MGFSTPVAGATSAEGEAFVEAEFTNTVSVERSDGSVYLWESEPNTIEVTFNATNESNIYKLCVNNEQGERVDCKDATAAPGNKTVTFEFENLTAFEGSSNATVILWNNYPGQSAKMGSDSVNITTISKTGDIDGDKLENANELRNNTSMFLMDTDSDSLEDGAEVKNYGTSPTAADTDHDNVADAAELSNSLSPVDPDTDGDGIPDGVEMKLDLAPKDPTADTDGDGLTDAYEWEHGSSPIVADTDGDGLNDKLETKLGTDPDDSSEMPMLMAAGGTLFGVAIVGGRWFINTREYELDDTVLAWFSLSKPAADAGEGDDDGRTAETDRLTEFDRDELLSSSQPTLTDEDKVIQLLREDDGWVYQSDIVENTNWSKSKVSRLLSRMADEGKIEKISVGRQNVVAEDGSMPEGFGSPFDE
ncbi:MarR family transcriptional regulator [Haloferax sp. DFSO52]|uniref:helix-turn-helix transcriptional regulator n=1 Tax=Haloferax sp. DFSO52 TaxID=3388505 RepID=UPI003A85C72A